MLKRPTRKPVKKKRRHLRRDPEYFGDRRKKE
jgi:hypothetical protein